MKTLKRLAAAALALMLCGCLEVDQHPPWLKGGYAGKVDQLPYQVHFHRDRLAWSAAIQNRALHQNEYNRARPPVPMPGPRTLAEPTAEPSGAGPGAGPQAAARPTPAPARQR